MAGGNAGLFGGIGPVAAVNQAYAPQQAYLTQQQAARNAALQAIFKAILGALPSQQSVDAPYLAASQDTNNLARASAAGLQAANPDAQTQAGLRAIGAPASQQQQVGNIDNTSFNGNAALLQYAGGVIPSGVFNQDMQARNTYLASLPAILAGYAKQGVGQLAGIADKENMGLAQDRANALLKARTDLANFVQSNQAAKATAAYRQATLGISKQKLADAEQNTAFTQKYKVTALNDTNFWKKQGYNLQVTKAQWQQANADRTYGLNYQKFVASEKRAAAIAKRNGLTPAGLDTAMGKAQDFAKGVYQGVPAHVTYPSSSNGLSAPRIDGWKQKPMTYQQAIRTMIQRYPALGAGRVIQIVDGLYQPGEGGRPRTVNTTGNPFGSATQLPPNYAGIGKTTGGFLPPGAGYQLKRTDQGRDIQTAPGTPIVAPGSGIVVRVGSDPGGGGAHFGPSYPIVYFTSGPYAGKTMYIGHTTARVRPGQRFTAGTTLSVTGNGGPESGGAPPGWAEIGFAPGGTPGKFGQKPPF